MNGGYCNGGIHGNGTCNCPNRFKGDTCDACILNHYGPDCLGCPDCVENQGDCNDSISGNGKCICDESFTGFW